jgi:hypothetical protein
MNRRYVMMAFVMLVLAMLACNRTVPTATPKTDTSGTEVATADVTPSLATDEPQLTPTSPLSSDTPAPGSATPTEGTPVCAYDAGFVADVTIPDDTELESNEVFTKTWRMRNTGDCAWEPGTLWAFDSGDQMDGPESVKAPILEPGDTADISVGLVAPDEPGTYTGYWRLRRPNAEDFGTRGYVRIIVSSDAGTPIPSATPTGEAGTAPTILFFRSNVDEADPGDTVTLEWETEGATRASLYHLMPTGQLGSFWEVEVDGTLDYDIDEGERNHTGFLLVATNDEESSTQASLSITLRCPDTWFFEPAPDACPASPAIVTAGAEQPFEHGVMSWVEDEGIARGGVPMPMNGMQENRKTTRSLRLRRVIISPCGVSD